MGLILGILLHFGAVYAGAHIADIEYIDTWRTIVVVILSYIAMFAISLVVFPLIFVPVLNLFLGPVILGTGTALAAKLVLSIDWKPAWTIGITAAVVGLLTGWILSGCS